MTQIGDFNVVACRNDFFFFTVILYVMGLIYYKKYIFISCDIFICIWTRII